MIAINDATLLALTKLKTRKVRTLFTIIVAGLLFSGVFAVLLISQDFSKVPMRFQNRRWLVAILYLRRMRASSRLARVLRIHRQTKSLLQR